MATTIPTLTAKLTGPSGQAIGVAFAVCAVAGMATALGGMFAFIPCFDRLSSSTVLAGSLSFSAGVMLIVSFMEIWPKSLEAMSDGLGPEKEGLAYFASMASFFLGFIVVYAMHLLVHRIIDVRQWVLKRRLKAQAKRAGAHTHHHPTASGTSSPTIVTEDVMEDRGPSHSKRSGTVTDIDVDQEMQDMERAADGASSSASVEDAHNVMGAPPTMITPLPSARSEVLPASEAELSNLGFLTAVAIGVHNFPEGFATFVATLADVQIGISVGTAIFIHNIPEGLAVASPIFVATKSKARAFLWALVSGITEPIGGLVAYAFLVQAIGEEEVRVLVWHAHAAAAAAAVGMLPISAVSLVACFFPPATYVTPCTVIGMVVMALSLVLYRVASASSDPVVGWTGTATALPPSVSANSTGVPAYPPASSPGAPLANRTNSTAGAQAAVVRSLHGG